MQPSVERIVLGILEYQMDFVVIIMMIDVLSKWFGFEFIFSVVNIKTNILAEFRSDVHARFLFDSLV